MILATIFTILFALLYAKWDADVINSGTWIKGEGHSKRFVLRFIIITLMTGAVLHGQPWESKLFMTIFQGTVFWIVFDHTLNILRKKPFWYVGRTAYLDRLFGEQIHLFKLIMLLFWGGAYYNF